MEGSVECVRLYIVLNIFIIIVVVYVVRIFALRL